MYLPLPLSIKYIILSRKHWISRTKWKIWFFSYFKYVTRTYVTLPWLSLAIGFNRSPKIHLERKSQWQGFLSWFMLMLFPFQAAGAFTSTVRPRRIFNWTICNNGSTWVSLQLLQRITETIFNSNVSRHNQLLERNIGTISTSNGSDHTLKIRSTSLPLNLGGYPIIHPLWCNPPSLRIPGLQKRTRFLRRPSLGFGISGLSIPHKTHFSSYWMGFFAFIMAN